MHQHVAEDAWRPSPHEFLTLVLDLDFPGCPPPAGRRPARWCYSIRVVHQRRGRILRCTALLGGGGPVEVLVDVPVVAGALLTWNIKFI